jgi:hypothetical protein
VLGIVAEEKSARGEGRVLGVGMIGIARIERVLSLR